jgi:hypothetical protein
MEKLKQVFQNIDTLSEECEETFHDLQENLKQKDKEKDQEDHYLLMRDRYHKYIHSFSPAYIQMSEMYIGPELTRDKYQKIFHPTYLDSKEDIKELYKLFVFYLLVEQIFGKIIV